MILRYLKGLAFFAGLLWLGHARAQTALPADTLVSQLQKFSKYHSSEKVHLHFDKPFYALGDTIWFAGYVVNAANNIPSVRSHILHVELINENDQITKALQIPVNVGFTSGDFTLADSLPAGLYKVRAYTNLMRNFDPEYFFTKNIRVIDLFPKNVQIKSAAIKSSKDTTTLQKASTYDIRFFPEGGQLVNGLTSAMGFKMVAQNGLGAMLSGTLLDEQNKPVLTFKATHAGMGSFMFTPAAGKTYTAVVKLPDGTDKRIALPAALNNGYVLSADNSKPDSLYITLKATENLVNKGDFTFVTLANGAPQFFMKTKFPSNQINITVPKNKVPGGILQLTLLNAQNDPVAERLVFNNHLQLAKINMDQLKPVYAMKEKTELALQAQDAAGNPAIGSFSVAVTNANAVTPGATNETTILSNLLLTSDLKGYIQDPDYYFTDITTEKSIALDNLMLTQGWRRFTWNEVANARQMPALFYPPEDHIAVSGLIKGSARAVKNNVPITLLAGQLGNGALLDTLTNEQGRFTFRVADSLANLPFRVQAKPKKVTTYEISLDHYLSPAIIDSRTSKSGVSDAFKNQDPTIINYSKIAAANRKSYSDLSMFKQATKLKEVVVKDNKPKPRIPNSHSSNLNGPGNADVVILPETLEKMPNLSSIDVLLPGVKVQPDQSSMRLLSVVGTHTPNVLILVDGVDAGDMGLNISPRDIESIEFMKNITYSGVYGIRGSGGVLLITTKRGGIDYGDITARAPNSISFKLPVYLKREFYSPQYDKPEKVKLPDQRTTVYWKPDVVTDKSGKAIICFYNTDVTAKYQIVIEGITSKGNLCRQVYNYTVE